MKIDEVHDYVRTKILSSTTTTDFTQLIISGLSDVHFRSFVLVMLNELGKTIDSADEFKSIATAKINELTRRVAALEGERND